MEVFKSHEYKQFVEWMATPPALRTIKDQRKLASLLGVHESTLSDWKKSDEFWKKVDKLTNMWGRSRTTEVINAFYNKIIANPTARDVRLWLEYFEFFKPNKKIIIQDSSHERNRKLDSLYEKVMSSSD